MVARVSVGGTAACRARVAIVVASPIAAIVVVDAAGVVADVDVAAEVGWCVGLPVGWLVGC